MTEKIASGAQRGAARVCVFIVKGRSLCIYNYSGWLSEFVEDRLVKYVYIAPTTPTATRSAAGPSTVNARAIAAPPTI